MAFWDKKEKNIIDYAHYYKDNDFRKTKWNRMDSLICATLSYLPIEPFAESRHIGKLHKEVERLENMEKGVRMAPVAVKLYLEMYNSRRYKGLKLSNFVKQTDDQTQFAAMTIRVGKQTIVSFEGTDGSLIGWLENFRLNYAYPTYTQTLAIDYLRNTVNQEDKTIRVVGHSKGGNLAMAAAMEADEELFGRIREVCNFDGPGFREEQIETAAYKRLATKLYNLVPEESVVGMMLNNKDYHICKSRERAVFQHDASNWEVFGEYFVEGKLSRSCIQFHKDYCELLTTAEDEKMEKVTEQFFKALRSSSLDNLHHISRMSFNDVGKIFESLRDIDDETYSQAKDLVKLIFTHVV